MGLHTPAILGGNSYLSWFYDSGARKKAQTDASKGLSQAINRGPIKKNCQRRYANVYVTSHSHGLSAGARSYYVTANEVRNGLSTLVNSWF